MASELYTMNIAKPGSAKRKKKTKAKVQPRRRKPLATRKKSVGRKRRPRPVAAPKFRSKKRKIRGSRGAGKLNLKSFVALAQTGVMNGAGAFASDLAVGFVRPMLPTILGFGQGRHLTRVAMGLVLGNLVQRFGGRMGRRFGNAITVGAATVAGFDFMKEFVQPMLPPGLVLGEYPDPMGEYTSGPGYQSALSYAGSAPTAEMGASGSETGYYNAYEN